MIRIHVLIAAAALKLVEGLRSQATIFAPHPVEGGTHEIQHVHFTQISTAKHLVNYVHLCANIFFERIDFFVDTIGSEQ